MEFVDSRGVGAVAARFGLDGGMIPRTVKRMFDERAEPRAEGHSNTAVLHHGGGKHVIRLGNLSSSGAMIVYSGTLRIGETVTLQLLDHGAVTGQVRWVRDGRVGINFAAPLE